jgi:hypothetical protein
MARYFIHLRDGTDELLDTEGKEFGSLDDLKRAVLKAARSIIADDVTKGFIDFRPRIDAEDESGRVVYSLPFLIAVRVIPHDEPVCVGANDG